MLVANEAHKSAVMRLALDGRVKPGHDVLFGAPGFMRPYVSVTSWPPSKAPSRGGWLSAEL